MRSISIAPSLLSCNFLQLEKEIEKCNLSNIDVIHIDVMDGHFVPNITIGQMIVAAIKNVTSIPIDCHLMISNPDKYISDFVKAGADMISVHAEATHHLHRTLSNIKHHGVKAGVALNPITPLSFAYEAAEFCDFILLMSVNPGFGGQSFISSCLPKVKTLRHYLDSGAKTEGVDIEIDGGIKADNLREVIDAGANIIVSGSGLFEGDFATNVATFREIINRK